MRKYLRYICAIAILIWTVDFSYAAEHGGTGTTHEEATKEHGGKMLQEPSSADIQEAIKAYVDHEVEHLGSLAIYDDEIDKTRRLLLVRTRELSLVRIHKRVGKTGDYYYSCADFIDLDSGETVDVDIDVENVNGNLKVVDVRIHKVNGKERHTYDENDNRIPIIPIKE